MYKLEDFDVASNAYDELLFGDDVAKAGSNRAFPAHAKTRWC